MSDYLNNKIKNNRTKIFRINKLIKSFIHSDCSYSNQDEEKDYIETVLEDIDNILQEKETFFNISI